MQMRPLIILYRMILSSSVFRVTIECTELSYPVTRSIRGFGDKKQASRNTISFVIQALSAACIHCRYR